MGRPRVLRPRLYHDPVDGIRRGVRITTSEDAFGCAGVHQIPPTNPL